MTILKFRIFRYLLLPLVLLCAGCVTVILDNESVMHVPTPDPLPFEKPICLNIKYESDSIDLFNRRSGVQEMHELTMLKFSSALPYYNIQTNCAEPKASLKVRVSYLTRNGWARLIWASGTVLSLGIIPFYVKETGTIAVLENDQVLADAEFEEKRLTSIFALPKWIVDSNRSIDQYSVDVQRATVTRKEVEVIKKALKSREHLISSP